MPRRIGADKMRVVDAMAKGPKVFDLSATAASIRTFFLDDHVHMAVVVGTERRLLTTIERADLGPLVDDHAMAFTLGTLKGRTIAPDVPLSTARRTMRRSNRRRLAIVDDHGALLGLLCMKRRGAGFCSDVDIALRRRDTRPQNETAGHDE